LGPAPSRISLPADSPCWMMPAMFWRPERIIVKAGALPETELTFENEGNGYNYEAAAVAGAYARGSLKAGSCRWIPRWPTCVRWIAAASSGASSTRWSDEAARCLLRIRSRASGESTTRNLARHSRNQKFSHAERRERKGEGLLLWRVSGQETCQGNKKMTDSSTRNTKKDFRVIALCFPCVPCGELLPWERLPYFSPYLRTSRCR
jgi:hypothetical protein